MNRAAIALTLSASAALLLAARREGGQIEAGEGDYLGAFDGRALIDRAESFYNQATEEGANVNSSTAARNVAAFLKAIQRAEGADREPDPYRVCYGYAHRIQSFADHPAITGEWRGERLPDAMCRNAGFGPGCVSSAAGAYQIIKSTWRNLRDALGLPDFGPASQDAAAVELIRRRGALADVQAGRLGEAVRKCRNEWASLPGNYAGQGQRSTLQLAQWFNEAGGTLA